MKGWFGDGRRLRLGGLSVGASLVVLGLAVLLILTADGLERRHALRMDFSFNGITSQSEASNRVLAALDKDVHAYMLSSPGQQDRALLGLLERYAARSPRFTFSEENLAKNPGLVNSISSSLSDNEVTSDSLILHCRDTGRTRVLDGSQYITQGYDPNQERIYIAGLQYEKSLTEAILFVSMDKLPELQLLQGHGELTRADTQALEQLLGRYHYAFRAVDLSRGDSLDSTLPLLILSPKKDLTNPDVQKLDAFAKAGGAFFITEDFSSAEPLSNFAALYRGYGFSKLDGLVVAMQAERGSYYESPAVLLPYMEESPVTAALLAANQSSLLMAGAAAFAEPAEINSMQTTVVLRSGRAYLRQTEDAFASLEQQEGDKEGSFPLALLTDRAFDDGTRSRAFIIGNSSLFTDAWMQQNTYSAEFLLNVMDYLDPGEDFQLAISPKDAIRAPFHMSSPWLVALLLVLLPLVALFAALFVLIPRRRM